MLLRQRVTKQMVRIICAALDAPTDESWQILPPDLRYRIEKIQAKHGFASYGHAFMGCIRVGLDVMESSFPVERKTAKQA